MKDKPKTQWVTASDVARRAGVSRSAVSRAFSPTASIAPTTRTRVMEAAAALGYQVNVIAREMNMRRSSLVGVVTAGFENPFRAKLLTQIITALGRHGLTPLVTNAEDPHQVEHSLEMLLSYRIAGVVMTSASPPLGLARQYLEHQVPVAMINREPNLPGADVAVSDNEAGAQAAARMLIRTGARRLAFVGPTKTSYSAQARGEGFARAVAQIGGRECQGQGAAQYVSTSDTYEAGTAAAHALFGGSVPPDAIFCSSDLLALGVIDTARHHYGLRVPGELAVIGFDDIPAAAYENYQLTTIHQDTQGLATAAVDMLVDRIGAFSGESRLRVVPVECIVRKTCP